jgi:starch synthase
MEKTRVLYISQEITPYLPETDMSIAARHLPQGVQEIDKEIRTFMPRFGCINERRHQLHEVIRLSGMNMIIDDTDHPLIIKVASIQPARMQVYFIDNEEYFKRKATFTDPSGKLFDDNDERSVFFCRGVLETVKKLGWAPHVIHCHGWMTSLVPLYIKTTYKDDPIFMDSKVVFSVYNDDFKGTLSKNYSKKAVYDTVTEKNLRTASEATHANILKLGIEYSDGVAIGSDKLNNEVEKFIRKSNKPVLDYISGEEFVPAYNNFYEEVLEDSAVLTG